MSASYHTARCYQFAYFDAPRNWLKAVKFYDYVLANQNLLQTEKVDDDNIHGFLLDDIIMYEVAASIAEMYEEGGYELEPVSAL